MDMRSPVGLTHGEITVNALSFSLFEPARKASEVILDRTEWWLECTASEDDLIWRGVCWRHGGCCLSVWFLLKSSTTTFHKTFKPGHLFLFLSLLSLPLSYTLSFCACFEDAIVNDEQNVWPQPSVRLGMHSSLWEACKVTESPFRSQ